MAKRSLQLPNVGLTHLFVKPWSVNELANGEASAQAGISRTNQIIAMCDAKGVVPIIIQPWAGQGITSAPGLVVAAYCDQLRSDGRFVFDARAIVANPSTGNIRSEFVPRDANGASVDTTHINEAGQAAVAAYALTQCPSWGIQ